MDFNEGHIEQARIIAKRNYENERRSVDMLPEIIEFPDLSLFLKNRLGVSVLVMLVYRSLYSHNIPNINVDNI
jgi:hypothetical protein